MQAWYLLYCKRGQLQRAQEHLERQSVNCLTPVITLEKMQRGKRTTVSEPLFPNYLFVEFDPEVIHTTTISATRGVSHFVRFGAHPATVPSTVIHQLSVYQQPEGITDPETLTRVITSSLRKVHSKACRRFSPSRTVKHAPCCCSTC